MTAFEGNSGPDILRSSSSPRDPICDIGWIEIPQCSSLVPSRAVLSFRSEALEAARDNEAARVHHAPRQLGGRVAARSARAANGAETETRYRVSGANLTMSYFSVDGLVSGIKSHMIEAPSKATAAILRNVVVRPKFAAIRPKTAVLRAAPIPDAVPMMP
jgi:hypothetical protein